MFRADLALCHYSVDIPPHIVSYLWGYDKIRRCQKGIRRQDRTTKRSGVLIGTAGVYFVASQLAAKGLHAAVTFGNAPCVDILVGLPNGAATLSLQVKTSYRALRTRGRGKNKRPDHYEWDVGERSGGLNQPDLFFAFVDLKGARTELPDVFIIPSELIFKAFDKPYFKSGVKRRWRYHPKGDSISQYKNNWKILENYLSQKTQSVAS